MKVEFNYEGIEFVVDPDAHQIFIDGELADGKYAPVGGVVVDVDAEDPAVCKVITDIDDTPFEKIIVYGAPVNIDSKVIILDKYVIPADIFITDGNNFAVVAKTGEYKDLKGLPTINGEVLIGDIEIVGGTGTGTTDYEKLRNLPYVCGKKLVGKVNLTAADVGAMNKNYTPPVTSVCGEIGAVTLTADDVGALPADTIIPSKTSQLTNDSGFLTAAPVVSVNTKTGVVTLTAEDVGALPYTTKAALKELLKDTFVTSVNGSVGDVTVSVGSGEGGTGGTSNYNELDNRPTLNGVTLQNNLTSADVFVMPYNPNSTSDTVTIISKLGFMTLDTAKEKMVTKVNGSIGEVELTAEDVGALPYDEDDTEPTKTIISELGFITDADIPQGSVTSVNGKTGVVTLTADDVGALPDDTTIPSKTSQLTNDSGYITRANAPVTSVNGKAGVVTLTAADVGAVSNTVSIPTKVSQLTNDKNYITLADVPAGSPGKDGEDGEDGLSAYDVYYNNELTNGRTPLGLEAWLESLHGKDGEDGEDGADGKGLDFDAVGTANDLSSYNDRPAGFKFSYSTTDAASGTTTVYIYSKASDASGDWTAPLEIVFYGEAQSAPESSINVNAPVALPARTSNTKYVTLDIELPNACIVGVSYASDKGEVFMPLFSAEGISGIERIGNKFTLSYGANCPVFSSGKIYLSQLAHTDTVSSSVSNSTGEGTVTFAEGIYYGYINFAPADYKLANLTADNLQTGIKNGTMRFAELKAQELSLGLAVNSNIVPGSTYAVVLVPEGWSAQKYNGINGWTTFEENVGVDGSGANGAVVTFGTQKFKVYGEYRDTEAEVTVNVSN